MPNQDRVTFRRIGGRIVPIKKKSDRNWGAFALAGAASAPLSIGAMVSKHKTKFGIAAGIATIGISGANIVNSYQHGKNRKSFFHGVGRYITNNLALNAGGFAAGLGLGGYMGYKALKGGVLKHAIRNLN